MLRHAHFVSSRGRSPLLPPSPVRLTRSVMANLDEINNIPNPIGRASEARVLRQPYGRAELSRANKTQRKTMESGSENDSSDDGVADDEDDETSDDDDDDEDGDDESEQPAVFAPPRGHNDHIIRKAGQLAEYRRMLHSEDPVLYEDPHDLFGGIVEDDDDDDFYRAVDDISDEDEQNDELFQTRGTDAALLLDQSASSLSLPDPEHETDFILDRVDGLSAYGFGDDLDTGDGSGEFSAPSDDGDLTPVAERHVHFGSDVEQMNVYGKCSSPSLTRALLPSAMPFEEENHTYALNTNYQTSKHGVLAAAEDAYDSMYLELPNLLSLLISFWQVMLLKCSAVHQPQSNAAPVSPRSLR
jgi:hypothetical protein